MYPKRLAYSCKLFMRLLRHILPLKIKGTYDDDIYDPLGCDIYVPRESVDAYKTAEGWRDYADDIKGYDFAPSKPEE